jgi:type III pantothenate kinase
MILCIDIGNTSIKFAVVANREVVESAHTRTGASATEIERALVRVMNAYVGAAALSSVSPSVTKNVAASIRRITGMRPLVVTSGVKMPITIGTRQPSKVGVDRLCAACGALTERKRNAIIVDIGSAITVDLVLDRVFMGGLIMPGPQMSLSALHHFTAQLPDLKLSAARGDRFDDTASAMLTGASVGTAGAIRAAVELLERRAARRGIPVWLTGGHASRLEKRLPRTYKSMPGLTLIGLAEISRYHRSRAR